MNRRSLCIFLFFISFKLLIFGDDKISFSDCDRSVQINEAKKRKEFLKIESLKEMEKECKNSLRVLYTSEDKYLLKQYRSLRNEHL